MRKREARATMSMVAVPPAFFEEITMGEMMERTVWERDCDGAGASGRMKAV